MGFLVQPVGGINMRPLVFLALVILCGAFLFGLRSADPVQVTAGTASPAQVAAQQSEEVRHFKRMHELEEAQKEEENRHQAAMNGLAERERQMELDHIQQTYQIEQSQRTQDLARNAWLVGMAAQAGIFAGVVSVFILGIGTALCLVNLSRARLLEQQRLLLVEERRRDASPRRRYWYETTKPPQPGQQAADRAAPEDDSAQEGTGPVQSQRQPPAGSASDAELFKAV